MIQDEALAAGEFGFQKDVNAMASIEARELGHAETSEIDCLLGATLEIEKSVQQPLRAIDPSKRAERKKGRFLIRQYKVSQLWILPLFKTVPNLQSFLMPALSCLCFCK